MCPTGWSVKPVKALDFVEEKMIPIYPLGVKKDESEGIADQEREEEEKI